jgi:hypothetical protein
MEVMVSEKSDLDLHKAGSATYASSVRRKPPHQLSVMSITAILISTVESMMMANG